MSISLSGVKILNLQGVSIPAPLEVLDLEDADTKLLLHMNGTNGSTAFTDASLSSHPTSVVGAQISTVQYKFGGASGLFGASKYLTIPYTSDFDLSSGDWTMECWFYANSFSPQFILCKDTYGSNFDWCIFIVSSTQIAIYTNGTGSNLTVTVPTMSVGTWYHVAIVNSGGTNKIYLDGTSYGSNTMSITNANTSTMTVGCASWNNPQAFFDGYVDEVRISKGVARYTSNFSPPVSEFAMYDQAKLPASPLEGQIVYADVGKTIAYICTDAAGPTWMRYTTVWG